MVSGISQNNNWNNVSLPADASVTGDNKAAELKGKGPLVSNDSFDKNGAPASAKDAASTPLMLDTPQKITTKTVNEQFVVDVLPALENLKGPFATCISPERRAILTSNAEVQKLLPDAQQKLCDLANNTSDVQFGAIIELLNNCHDKFRISVEGRGNVISALHMMVGSEQFNATLLLLLSETLDTRVGEFNTIAPNNAGLILKHDRDYFEDRALLHAWLKDYNASALKKALEILNLPEDFVEANEARRVAAKEARSKAKATSKGAAAPENEPTLKEKIKVGWEVSKMMNSPKIKGMMLRSLAAKFLEEKFGITVTIDKNPKTKTVDLMQKKIAADERKKLLKSK